MPRLLEEMGGMKQRLNMWREGHTRRANVLQKGEVSIRRVQNQGGNRTRKEGKELMKRLQR